jgi:hypothetical protein
MDDATRPAQNPWIRSPGYDLIFFSTLWLAPILLALFYGLVGVGVGVIAIALLYHAILRLPHFIATFRLTYANPANWKHYRERWVLYFVVPPVILVVCALPSLLGHRSLPLYRELVAVAAGVWGIQHVGMQNYGILSLYRRRANLTPDPEGAALEKRILHVLIIAAGAGIVGSLFGTGEAVRVGIDCARLSLYAAAAALVTWYLARAARAWRQPITTWPAVLYFLTALAVMVRWPFYDQLATPGLRTGMFFFVFNGHHCLAYLGLLFMMDCNKREAGRPVFMGWRDGARQFATYVAPLVGVSLLALWATTGAFTMSGLQAITTEKTLDRALGLFTGTFVVHYYIEALSWRFSNAYNRKTVLPLLRAPRLAPAPSTASAAPALHSIQPL